MKGWKMQVTDKSMAPEASDLKKAFSGTLHDAQSLQVRALSGDASSRRYFRVEKSSQSYVLQVDKPFASSEERNHPYISALHLLKKLGLPVPEYYGSSPSEGWVLLSDLGDNTLQNSDGTENYEEALFLLIRLVTGAESFQSQKLDSTYEGPHFGWAFDRAKLGQEMDYTAKHLVESYLQMNPQEYLDAVAPTINYLSDRPRFLCHRDYHCRNLMFHSGKLWMIDFQDARMGPLSYDVVSLLWDPYVQIDNERRTELLAFWKKSLLKTAQGLQMSRLLEVFASPVESASSFECELERMKVQRLLKAAGSYASFLNLKGRKDYLPSIRPALLSAREALNNIVKQTKWKCVEDERLLTLLDNYIKQESKIQ